MIIWLILAAITLASLAYVVPPLLRRRHDAARRGDYDLAVYKDQLEEVERDLDRGVLSPEQAGSAKLEIQRRMIATTRDEEQAPKTNDKHRRFAALALIVAVPALAAIVYGAIGNPHLPGQPFVDRMAQRLSLPPDEAARMLTLVDQLAERMRQNPEDPQGWLMLARSYRALGRQPEAVDALRNAVRAGAQDADTLASLGEALVFSANGEVTPDAQRAFDAALNQEPAEPRARFYLGAAQAQGGNFETALAIWRDLEQDSASDAPWLPMLRDQMAAVAAQSGIDPQTIEPEPPQPSNAIAVSPALQGMTNDQIEMVQGMVTGLAARLEEDPEDYDGWMRLGRSYGVLAKPDEAKNAYLQAMKLRPADPRSRLAYVQIALEGWQDGDALAPDLVAILREVQQLDPSNTNALYLIGLAEAQAGRADEARRIWTELRDSLPEGNPSRESLQQRLDELPAS